MPSRTIRLDIPGVTAEDLARLGPAVREIGDMMSVPGSSSRTTLRTAARVLECVHVALLAADAEEEDLGNMTDGEIAVVRNLKVISSKLETITELMRRYERSES